MSDYSIERLLFEDIQGKKIEADFEGGQVTSDAGVLLLREVVAFLTDNPPPGVRARWVLSS